MGIFTAIFESNSSKYSNNEQYLSAIQIKQLVSRVKVKSLSHSEESLVEQTIIARRRGDGKISLHQIDEVLRKLKHTNKISNSDWKGLMRVFSGHFNK